MNQRPPKWLVILLLPMLPVFLLTYCVAFLVAAIGEMRRER